MDIRELGYFVAVAEELNFSRAALRLGIAQPPLSRAIQRLERKLGVALLTRTSRQVTLTEAGRVLLADAPPILAAASAAALRAQRAGAQPRKLVVAMKPSLDDGLLPRILDAFADDPVAVPVDIVVYGIGEDVRIVQEGRADVAFVHDRGADLSGLDTIEFRRENQLAVLPPDHRLARHEQVSLAELRDDALPCWPGDDLPIREAGQLMQLIALGRAVAVLPTTASRYVRDDVACVPVPDAPPSRILLAWPQDSHSPTISAFVRIATKIGDETRCP